MAPRIHLPVADTAQGILTRLGEAARAGTADVSTARQMMIESYRQFVSDPQAREQFAAAARLIAAPGGIPAMFHCTAGKDRTGWLSAIILTALGVDQRTVFADYLITNGRFTPAAALPADTRCSRPCALSSMTCNWPSPSWMQIRPTCAPHSTKRAAPMAASIPSYATGFTSTSNSFTATCSPESLRPATTRPGAPPIPMP